MNQISTRIEHLKGPVCIMGLSGIGKTHLATSFPELVFDTDRALDKATESEWPHLSAYDRRRAWRVFCSKKPWDEEKENLSKWSAIRKKYVSLLGDYFEREEDCLILTSEFNFPHRIDLYVGVDIGCGISMYYIGKNIREKRYPYIKLSISFTL